MVFEGLMGIVRVVMEDVCGGVGGGWGGSFVDGGTKRTLISGDFEEDSFTGVNY